MRRTQQYTYDLSRSNFESHKCHDYSNKFTTGILLDIQKDLRKFTFHMRMDTVDISDFFPVNDDETLEKFLDKDHPDWQLRKRGFYHLLYNTLSTNPKKFAAALLHTVFTRNFISKHKWPGQGYEFIPLYIIYIDKLV